MDLPIFSDNMRSSASWAERLASEGKDWDSARQSPELRLRLDERIRREQIDQALKRAGERTNEHKLHKAAELVSRWAADPKAKFGVEKLLDLHRIVIGAPSDARVLRIDEAAPIIEAHEPTPASILPQMLEKAFEWFGAESFEDLHPVERSAVVYLRLLDLYPFPSQTETTATLAAGFYLEREEMPPLIIFADDQTQARYTRALEAAFRMLTQPLVEFFAESLARSMRLCLGIES